MENGSERTWGRFRVVLYRSGRSRSKCSVDVVFRGGIRSSNSGSSGMSSREARKARRDRMKDAKEGERRRKQQQQEGTKDDDDEDDNKAAAPGPDEGSSAVYVAYHDWEHYSSIRNLTGPHQGLPNEKPPPDEMVLNEPPSPAPSPAATRETVIIIVFPAFYDHSPVDPLQNLNDEERYRRRALRANDEHDDSQHAEQQRTVILHASRYRRLPVAPDNTEESEEVV